MSGRKNKFSKAMTHLKSSKIDEKIGYLNKEMKKMGVISEQPANSTADLYSTIEYIPAVPESPAEYTDVPDPNGVRSAEWTQPSNGFDVNDPATWDNAFNDFSWMYNSDDVAGETNRPVLESQPTTWDGATAGAGIMLAHVGWGQSLGYLSDGGVYQPLVTAGSMSSGMVPPIERGSHFDGAHYTYAIPDDRWAAMQGIYAKFQSMTAAGNVATQTIKVWYGYSYFWYGSWENYGGVKRDIDGSRSVLINATLFKQAGNYMSKPHENEIPGYTVVLTQHGLDDPNYYAGNPNGFMDFLRNALDVGREAFDWLLDLLDDDEVAGGLPYTKDDDPFGADDSGDDWEDDSDIPGDFPFDFASLGAKDGDMIAMALNTGDATVDNLISSQDLAKGAKKMFDNLTKDTNVKTTESGLVQYGSAGVSNAASYLAALASNLVGSILTGTASEIKITASGAEDLASKMDVNELEKVITFNQSTPLDAENTINPVGKTDQVVGGLWGVHGGSTYNVNLETGKLEIVSNKTLRTTSGGEYTSSTWTTDQGADESGKTDYFSDIPTPSPETVEAITKNLLKNPVVDKFLGGLSNVQDFVLGTGDTYDSLGFNNSWDYLKSQPNYQNFVKQVSKVATNITAGTVQGTASNAYAVRQALVNLGLPQSDVEKMGGAIGQVSSKAEISLDKLKEINPKAYEMIMSKKSSLTNESYLSEGWESPKHTYIDKNQQKRWFKEKDVAPVYPKKAPPKMMNGYHPSLLPKLGTEDTPIPQIKIRKKDLLRNHNLKKDEVKKLINLVDSLNDYIKRNPEYLAYARERYPKHDPRLATLNYKMDMQLAAADEYVEKHFPENKRLLNKVLKATKQSIKLTDPKTFKSKDGTFTTFNKLERARHFDNEYKPKERKVIKKRRGKSVSRFFYKPKKKSKYDILKDKMAVLDNEMKKMMPDA
jgi:hypothetical protein